MGIMILNDFISQVLNEQDKKNNPWFGSLNENFKNLPTPQAKGKVGVLAFQKFLQQSGCKTRLVNDQGDIEYKLPNTTDWIRDEVKTASASFKYRKRDNSFSTEHWFNQIRPNQESWHGVTLVAVYPYHYEIYRKSREEYFQSRIIGASGITPGHTGTDELDQVKLVDNTNRNGYNDWELIYEGE